MSYLSRPLLLKEASDGARHVYWGTRALIRTNEYLLHQMVEGRFAAESDDLRSLQGRIANRTGEAFNDRVAEVYEAAQGLIVCRRVTSIAGRRIERRRGQPLGTL